MKKTFVCLLLCMALSFSLTVSASAEFTSSDSTTLSNVYKQLMALNDELGYPQGNYSSLRRAVNYIADNLPKSYNYTTVLSNIKDNTDLLYQYIKLIEGDTNSITARATEIFNKLNDVYVRQGQMQLAITNHLDSGFAQNHSDISSLHSFFSDVFHTQYSGPESSYSGPYRYELVDGDNHASLGYFTLGGLINRFWLNLTSTFHYSGRPSLYGAIYQLQQVLASDDDLQLKKDNKANEDAVTDGFVNGSSSKTSLGTSDFANLKDIGGSFNDLSSLNGQSSVGSFTSGLSSADEVGQGWFSVATRSSLDAVSPASSNSASSVRRAPSSDPYHMDGFEENYAWLWGDAS